MPFVIAVPLLFGAIAGHLNASFLLAGTVGNSEALGLVCVSFVGLGLVPIGLYVNMVSNCVIETGTDGLFAWYSKSCTVSYDLTRGHRKAGMHPHKVAGLQNCGSTFPRSWPYCMIGIYMYYFV